MDRKVFIPFASYLNVIQWVMMFYTEIFLCLSRLCTVTNIPDLENSSNPARF